MELDLTKEEIIVLTGLLKRYSDSDVFAVEDQAEQRALWNLEWRKVSENEPESTKENWGKLSFRCNSALHKAGLK